MKTKEKILQRHAQMYFGNGNPCDGEFCLSKKEILPAMEEYRLTFDDVDRSNYYEDKIERFQRIITQLESITANEKLIQIKLLESEDKKSLYEGAIDDFYKGGLSFETVLRYVLFHPNIKFQKNDLPVKSKNIFIENMKLVIYCWCVWCGILGIVFSIGWIINHTLIKL